MVSSRFNTKHIGRNLALIALSTLSMGGISLISGYMFAVTLLLWLSFTLVFSIIYLASLNRIVVLADGLEVQSLLFPFLKKSYRFAEFDYAKIEKRETEEVYRLIKDGKRIVKITSDLYENYNEIMGAIAVKDQGDFTVRDNAEVVSEYAKLRLFVFISFFSFFTLGGILLSLSDVIQGTPIRVGMVMIGVFDALFFGGILLLCLLPYMRISVWRGQIEVRPFLCPFSIRYYTFSDFDGYYHVTEKTDGQLGSKDECGIWLVKNNKLRLGFSETMYNNYEELKTAFENINCLGHLEMGGFQALKYYFGKQIVSR